MTAPTNLVCISCRKPQAVHVCGLCEEPVCRNCEVFLSDEAFAFLPDVEPELKHTYYCAPCHEERVEPELEQYRETLERAKGVFFFFETRKKPIPFLRKGREPVVVSQCADRDETILRMGFMAAKQGFNAIVDAEVVFEKVRDHGYEKKQWRGRGLPVEVDAERLDRHFY